MTDENAHATWEVAEWHSKMIPDRNGEKIGRLQDVYIDVETDEPKFATVKEGFFDRHLTFVPLAAHSAHLARLLRAKPYPAVV